MTLSIRDLSNSAKQTSRMTEAQEKIEAYSQTHIDLMETKMVLDANHKLILKLFFGKDEKC